MFARWAKLLGCHPEDPVAVGGPAADHCHAHENSLNVEGTGRIAFTMSRSPNVFRSLFAYRPRSADTLRKEDFLTAAFAYVLETFPAAATAVCARCVSAMSTIVGLSAPPVVRTWHRFVRPGGGEIVPDMVISCRTLDGADHVLIFEHKWESPADASQLRNYRAVAEQVPGTTLRVVFVGATPAQSDVAKGHCDVALTWRDVHDLIASIASQTVAAGEFLDFLSGEHLALVRKCTEEDEQRSSLVSQILALKDWAFLPERFRRVAPRSRQRWGRVGVELGEWPPKTAPGILAGFLLEGTDHRLRIADAALPFGRRCRFPCGSRLNVDIGPGHFGTRKLRWCEQWMSWRSRHWSGVIWPKTGCLARGPGKDWARAIVDLRWAIVGSGSHLGSGRKGGGALMPVGMRRVRRSRRKIHFPSRGAIRRTASGRGMGLRSRPTSIDLARWLQVVARSHWPSWV